MKYLADGLALFPSEGRARGGIRIRERLRPLRSARALASALVAEMGMPDLEIGPIERITTAEGEYAALTTIRGQGFERALAFVFGDDFYTLIDAAATQPGDVVTFRTLTRDLAYYYSLGLGELRRRRYWYEPPAQWLGFPRGLITEWHPPDYPNHAAMIAAFAARPIDESVAGVLDRALHELRWTGFSQTALDERPLRNRHGLTGVLWCVKGSYAGGALHHQDIAMLTDNRFFYVARLESLPSRLEEGRAVFAALFDSIEPLPRPDRSARASDAVMQWVD